AAANYPNIRLIKVGKKWTPEPQKDMEGTWKICTPTTVAEGGWHGFSACGFFFGRELHKALNVPVGLIDASWGGTCIQTWTPPEGFATVPALKKDYERVQMGDPRTALHKQVLGQTLKQAEEWLAAAKTAMNESKLVPVMPTYPQELLAPQQVQNATALYNGMIHPICPFALQGAIWYQGEFNNGEGMLYAERMKALVGGWRQLWSAQDKGFPFYFVQIAPYKYGASPFAEPELWEAQATATKVIRDCGMTVISDIGNLSDIHPANKQDVGKRLAALALVNTYGKKGIVSSGPVFKDMKIDGVKLRISFDHTGSGLTSRDGKPLDWFEVIDADEGGFVKADALIDGQTVILSAAAVKKPVAMRFAWHQLAEPNLMNKEGLPAWPFRAGDVPKRDWMSINVPEANEYKLVYDLDLAKLGHDIKYDIDNHANVGQSFDRIAYCLELQQGEESKCVYVSMDAFTQDPAKIGIPSIQSGAKFQQNVKNMNVFSNVKEIKNGAGLQSGNIEFWPGNYGPQNSANIKNASAQLFDFGDQPGDPQDGYGSMQIHNHDAKQTLMAINHWAAGAGADIGIGNMGGADKTDWTFAGNAGSYQMKRLRVLVRTK
ncbi:MAG: 9-O-acetylesterase, partial [Lentisphaerae bacterium RIFOXYA12_FULL_48_11]